MKDGDVLIVPEIKVKYAVVGQVGKPGTYPVPEERTITVADAIAEAGGSTGSGEQRKVILRREVNGKVQVIKINLLDLYNKGDNKNNMIIQDKDMIIIPTRGTSPDINTLTNPLLIFSNLYNVFGR